MLRAMLANDGFRAQFINRCADLLNTTFKADAVVESIEELASGIRSEIPRHLERWNWTSLQDRGFGSPFKPEDEPLTPELWERHVATVIDFAKSRPDKLRRDLMDHFNLTGGVGEIEIDVQPKETGRVFVNSLEIKETPWRGVYFVDQPVMLRVEAAPGFEFMGWSKSGIEPDSEPMSSVQVPRDATSELQARFRSPGL